MVPSHVRLEARRLSRIAALRVVSALGGPRCSGFASDLTVVAEAIAG
jgi:hypothetical protein